MPLTSFELSFQPPFLVSSSSPSARDHHSAPPLCRRPARDLSQPARPDSQAVDPRGASDAATGKHRRRPTCSARRLRPGVLAVVSRGDGQRDGSRGALRTLQPAKLPDRRARGDSPSREWVLNTRHARSPVRAAPGAGTETTPAPSGQAEAGSAPSRSNPQHLGELSGGEKPDLKPGVGAAVGGWFHWSSRGGGGSPGSRGAGKRPADMGEPVVARPRTG